MGAAASHVQGGQHEDALQAHGTHLVHEEHRHGGRKAAKGLQKWLDDCASPASPADDEKDAKQGDELEIIFEKTLYKQRAFADHETPHLMRNAADYSDQWLKEGKTSLSMFYICSAGGTEWQCNTVVGAQAWKPLKKELEATKQQWYCKMCRTRWKIAFGVLVEIINGPQAFYSKAEVSPFDLQDSKYMKIEEDYRQYATPLDTSSTSVVSRLGTLKMAKIAIIRSK